MSGADVFQGLHLLRKRDMIFVLYGRPGLPALAVSPLT